MAWFRFYDDVVDDPKVQRLPFVLFRAWVNCLCIAKQNGGILPDMDVIAYKMRVKKSRAIEFFETLVAQHLIDLRPDGHYEMHNWEGRQFESDTSTQRVKKFREKQRNVSATFHETDQNRTEQSRTEEEPPLIPPLVPATGRRTTARKTRAPENLEITDGMRQWARENGITVDLSAATAAMLDHHRGKGNLHSDWVATWRTWMRNTKRFGANGNGHKSKTDRNAEAAQRLLSRLDQQDCGGNECRDQRGHTGGLSRVSTEALGLSDADCGRKDH